MATSKRVQGQQFRGAPTIAQLNDAVAAATAPMKGTAPSGFKGGPLIGTALITSGERAVGAASASGERFPEVFGGGKRIGQKTPGMPRVKGSSASGVQGAH